MFLIVSSFMMSHIFACLWVFFSQLSEDGDGESFMTGEAKDMTVMQQYLTSFYFIITTFSTVGYGDISAANTAEKLFCIVVMCVGVTAFAAGTSTLTNVLQNYDSENNKLDEKLDLLNKIYH